MTRATDELLDQLHMLAATTLLDQVEVYTKAVDNDGKPAPQPVPPALLSQILKFLKDNGIDSPARAKRLEDRLSGVLPDFDDVENEHEARH